MLVLGPAIALAAAAGGCGGGSSAAGARTGDVGLADRRFTWQDVDSAVSVGCRAIDAAVVSRVQVDSLSKRYELLTIRDEEATVEVRLPASGAAPWDDRVEYEARIGRFGDSAREARLVEAITAWRPAYAR